MNANFRIPNMGSIAKSGKIDNRMTNILENINNPIVNEPDEDYDHMDESIQTFVCPVCGATFDFDSAEDGSTPTCPICNFQVNEAPFYPNVETEQSGVVESLENVFDMYEDLLENEQYEEARDLLESEGVSAIVEDNEIILEKMKTIVHADGSVTKKKVRTGPRKRMSSKQKAALKKARKKAARDPKAKKARMKAMKKRAKKFKSKKNEMLQNYSVTESVMSALRSEGVTSVDRSTVARFINENKVRTMDEKEEVEATYVDTLTDVLADKGLEVVDSDVEEEDGVYSVEVTVEDIDDEVYLGEICDELSSELDCEVEYDEPIPDDDDPSLVNIVFYFLPREAIKEYMEVEEECELDDEDCTEGCKKTEKCNRNKNEKKCNEEDDMEECDKLEKCNRNKNEKKCNEEDDMEECDKLEGCNRKKNESFQQSSMKALNESFEDYAGGAHNVRCKLNPAFIKPGQVIFDADQNTVFKALTESVDCGSTFNLTIDVLNSEDNSLCGLSGADVNITSNGRYFLLKSNPVD